VRAEPVLDEEVVASFNFYFLNAAAGYNLVRFAASVTLKTL
jgi:hypothetical protein